MADNIPVLPPLSLYIHIPWCVRKCPYCDFNSHTSQHIPEQAYLDQLLKDLHLDLGFVQQRPIESIFFGGGTPSLMSADFYRRLLHALGQKLTFSNNIEITLEANPGTTEYDRFEGYLDAGINRLSIGVQSLQAEQLQQLGRIHNPQQAINAFKKARRAGFDNINLDLMHGLPGQTVDQALDDLNQAIELSPEHLSWYQLTIEPNTEFYRHTPTLPDEPVLWEILEQGSAVLYKAGYKRYEISAYCRDRKQARHNINYWTFGDYIGLGAGAHSKVSVIDNDTLRILRFRKSRVPKDYLLPRPQFRVGEQTIDRDDLPLEFMMNALRLTHGVEESLYHERTGQELDAIKETLVKLRKQQLLDPDRLQATEKGYLYLDGILAEF